MIICLIILLFLADIALRIAISGLDVAVFVAKRADDARRLASGMVIGATTTIRKKKVGKAIHNTALTANTVINLSTTAARTALTVAKPIVKMGARAFLVLLRIILKLLRKLLTALSITVIIVDVIIAIIIIAASSWFVIEYTNTDDNGEVVVSEEVPLSDSEYVALDHSYLYTWEDINNLVTLYSCSSFSKRDIALDVSYICNLYEESVGTYSSIAECVIENSKIANVCGTNNDEIYSEDLRYIISSILGENKRFLPSYINSVISVSDIEESSNNKVLVSYEGYHKNVTECTSINGVVYTYYDFSDNKELMYCYIGKVSQEQINNGCYDIDVFLSEMK